MREVELAIIGGLLVDQSVMGQICNIVDPKMFRDSVIGKIYSEILKAYESGLNADLPYYVQEVCSTTALKSDVVMGVLHEAISQSISPKMVKSDAQALVKDYMTREFKKLLSDTRPDASNIESQIAETMDSLAKIKVSFGSKAKSLSSIAKKYKNDYFKPRNEKDVYDIGLPKVDEILGFIEGGDVFYIGARPAVGKSAFATQICAYLGKKNKKTLYFNLEMSDQQVYERFIVNESGIGLTRLKRATCFLNDEEQRFRKANEILESGETIDIINGSMTVSEIRAECINEKPDIVVIDYMQLIKPDGNYRGNRYAEVGAISHAIKAIAMELKIPVIVLAQLNRQSMERDTKEPTMAEFRESGDIEQDASQIILLWNMDENDKTKKGCKIEKNRQGRTGKVELFFNGDLMRFTEYEPGNTPKAQTGGMVPDGDGFFDIDLENIGDLPFEVGG